MQGKGYTPPLLSSMPIKHPPQTSLTYNRMDPLCQDVLLLAQKRVYKLIFHHQKFVYRHNNNIKPKKVI